MVKRARTEATFMARLYGLDPDELVGLLYLWNNGELSILWAGRKTAVGYIDPPINDLEVHISLPTNSKILALLSQAQPRTSPKS